MLGGLLAASAARATDQSNLVQPGWLRYNVEPRFELQRAEGSKGLTIQNERYTLPLILQYGLVEGMEAVIEIPFVRYGRTLVDNATPAATKTGTKESEFGIGDVALGFKYRLLEDTGRNPALFIQPLLKLPTGTSSLEAYVRNLEGEDVKRGTGSGSLDLQTAVILSAYADPFENYVKLDYDVRGGDERLINGVRHHVDYGTRMSLLGGIAVDLGERWSVAVESLAVVSHASNWRQDGQDRLALTASAGVDSQSFMAETLSESGINLGSTTEWYIGPKIGFRIWKGFALGLRFEAGLTPESLPYRGGIELSGAFRPGRIIGRVQRRKAESAAPTESASLSEDRSDESMGDQERGNLQRYLHRRLRLAEEAAQSNAWSKAADELSRLLELSTYDPGIRERLDGLQLRLQAQCESSYQAGLAAIDKADWSGAAKALKELPAQVRGLDAGRPEIRDFKAKLAAKAHEIHLKGQDLYIKDQPKEALELWNVAALLNPADKALQRDIERARAKLKAIQSLKQ